MPVVFDNRDTAYISQTAPVAAGVGLRFSVILHNDCNCYEAFMIIARDGCDGQCIKMEYDGKVDEVFNRYSCTFTAHSSGLYWYRFEYEGNFRRNIITCVERGRGDITERGGWWQLTVYDAGFTTPDSYKGGIIYQIFPDRFYNSGTQKHDVPHERFIVENWSDLPAYKQNNGPRSLCRDYFCGDLKGIEQKLDYIASLGVSVIYLNPVFEAHENHRYNTADYMKIDPLLGDEADFASLCRAAGKRGIKIVLDGVFSHTGADSRYFNMYSRYEQKGAFNTQSSPYFSWYKFTAWPGGYHSWWGVPSLPEVNEDSPSFTEFICGENGVIRHWMRLGADGWRLDVADELPDAFLDRVRAAVKAENPDGILIGEVWEDASNKISGGGRRRFLQGRQLDSVMNYPFKNAIIDFIMRGDGYAFTDAVERVLCNYPKQCVDTLMNHIGTHDTERILSVLGGLDLSRGREEQANMKLTAAQRDSALKKLRVAAVLQYTLPGIPSLYYADEAGAEGMRDPFNRTTYPWGCEDAVLVEFYRTLGDFRRKHNVYARGEYKTVYYDSDCVLFLREDENGAALTAVNRSDSEKTVFLPEKFAKSKSLFGLKHNKTQLVLPPVSAEIFFL